MLAWAVDQPGPVDGSPLLRVERAVPEPVPGQVRMRVRAAACAAPTSIWLRVTCPPAARVVPGHEVVGASTGWARAARLAPGRPGRRALAGPHLRAMPLLLCPDGRTSVPTPSSRAGTSTGATPNSPWSMRTTSTRCPRRFDDVEAAPLLCAGIIGYRALQRANLPAGGRLGIYGFGGSAHLTAQVALAEGARVHVLTRSPEARALALELGVASAGDAAPTPEPLDAAILFAPVGTLVPPALPPSTGAGPWPSPASI